MNAATRSDSHVRLTATHRDSHVRLAPSAGGGPTGPGLVALLSDKVYLIIKALSVLSIRTHHDPQIIDVDR
jgi:hypothetical protein